ncbi:MAG: hypothetical protein CV082_05835 [Candidatus Brocadia sp. BL1]|nr:MAG: hypothetical protein CV082_05835 [Candidatus Brocadia sp. BL1]
MGKPEVGSTMQVYCDCANKKGEVIYSSVNTTWICKSEYLDIVKNGIFSSVNRFKYYWECLNCGKTRDVGIWDTEGSSYGVKR